MNPVLNVNGAATFFGKDCSRLHLGVTVWIDPSSSEEFFDIDRCQFYDSLDLEFDSDNPTPFDFIRKEYEWIERVRVKAGRSSYREIYNCIAHALEHVDGVVICSPNRDIGDNISYLYSQIGNVGTES